jgi:hypothetical protein
MQQFAPRGWRAALAAEREGMARLRLSARESTESVSRHAGRITARLLTPLLSDPPAVPDCKPPSVSSQQTEAVCPSIPIAEDRDTVAVIAFVAGWLSGQWHLQRQWDRRKWLVERFSAPGAATAAAAAAQAAPDTASLAAAEQAQRRAAGCSADQAAPSAGSHPSNEAASPEQSAALQPAAADSAAEGPAAESVSSHSDVSAASLEASPLQHETASEPQLGVALPAAVQPPAQQASSQTAAHQVWRACTLCIPLGSMCSMPRSLRSSWQHLRHRATAGKCWHREWAGPARCRRGRTRAGGGGGCSAACSGRQHNNGPLSRTFSSSSAAAITAGCRPPDRG